MGLKINFPLIENGDAFLIKREGKFYKKMLVAYEVKLLETNYFLVDLESGEVVKKAKNKGDLLIFMARFNENEGYSVFLEKGDKND